MLSETTGLRLLAALVFDHPTPAGLAAHLAGLLEQESSTTALPGPPDNPVLAPVHEALRRGSVPDAIDLARTASRLRSTYSDPAEADLMPEPVLLTRGTKKPDVICLPFVLALAGVHQYDLLAAEFTGSHTVRVLPAPGYSTGQPLPYTGSGRRWPGESRPRGRACRARRA